MAGGATRGVLAEELRARRVDFDEAGAWLARDLAATFAYRRQPGA